MKLALEQDDITAIVSKVVEGLQPLLRPLHDTNTADPIMEVKELAAYLKVKPSWVYKQVEYKTIPHFHAGRYPRFRQSEIDAWVKRMSVDDTAPPYPSMKAG